MAKLSIKDIQALGKKIILGNAGGIRYSELVEQIHNQHPETERGTISTAVVGLAQAFPTEITNPSRGLFIPAAMADDAVIPAPPAAFKEEDFYEPFALWLKNELDEVTDAIGWGGAGHQKKWGTPDVIGIYKPLASDRIKFDLELVSAEIKIDPSQSVVAFGQATAYRLFSAKSYIVMPNSISEEDYSRLEALCMLFGIGLVLFETKPADPDFKIRVRAQRFPPDMFYVNEFAERIFQIDTNRFNRLFG